MKRIIWSKLIFSVMGLATLLTACAEITAAPAPPTSAALTGRLTFAGSTTVQPLAGYLGEMFQQRYPQIELEIAAGGSVVGIEAVQAGAADIGMASRALKPAEAKGIKQNQIALDVLAIVVNPANPLKNLTLKQLRAIYTGKVTHWREVGGPDWPIVVIVREESSGTRGAFDEIALQKQKLSAPGLKVAITAGDMAASVAANRAAIGYVGFGNLEPNLKVIALNNVLPSPETARTGSYSLVRPLLLLTGPLSQPQADVFVDFALSTAGQGIVEKKGWIPVQELKR